MVLPLGVWLLLWVLMFLHSGCNEIKTIPQSDIKVMDIEHVLLTIRRHNQQHTNFSLLHPRIEVYDSKYTCLHVFMASTPLKEDQHAPFQDLAFMQSVFINLMLHTHPNALGLCGSSSKCLIREDYKWRTQLAPTAQEQICCTLEWYLSHHTIPALWCIRPSL